jgi:hypothetical protein
MHSFGRRFKRGQRGQDGVMVESTVSTFLIAPITLVALHRTWPMSRSETERSGFHGRHADLIPRREP